MKQFVVFTRARALSASCRTFLAIAVTLPAFVEAQESRVRAEQLDVQSWVFREPARS
jgi:hypothetical protein